MGGDETRWEEEEEEKLVSSSSPICCVLIHVIVVYSTKIDRWTSYVQVQYIRVHKLHVVTLYSYRLFRVA